MKKATNESKEKWGSEATDLAFKYLNKAFGVGAGVVMSEIARACDMAIPIGIASIDYGLLGIGGIPSGQFIQIYGKEGTGKTTMLLTIIAAMQRKKRTVFVIDQKCAIASDLARARRIGVDPDNVIILPIETSQDALDKTKQLILGLRDKGLKMAFCWDDLGLAATKSSLVIDKAKKDEVAELARSVWRFCRSLSGVCYRADVPMVVVNQLTALIGSFGKGPRTTTSGGGGIRFASRIGVNLAKGEQIKSGSEVVGHVVYARTDKSAFFAPNQKVQLHLDYRNGILDKESTILNARAKSALKKAKDNSWYRCPGIVDDFKPLYEWTVMDIAKLEMKLWPWMEDPQGYDWKSVAKDADVDDDSIDSDALDEFFGGDEDG